ncbi:TIGR02556 family CRISPR-associated protein [Methanotorris formicicus]|uniref:CRISPR-associated protein, Csh1 family n=1 Tax=Methanotorris formicicus Mc-S-70 TaxID=647171 RepID=H1L0A8_9EURY|nr:TIGR02556 family CRISPR-associated protein [Methanotorris formicicus]EHP85065.1 CRISPR-associated protein, Csh1 family [Methanotorris formicicus Mc-S-70]
MLSSVATIGKYIIEKEGKDINNPLSILVENPDVDGKYNIIFKIAFDGDFNYLGVFDDRFDSSMILRLLYKKGSPRGADLSPTSKLVDAEKTFRNKILKAVADAKKYKKTNFLKRLETALKDNAEKIIEDIEKLKKNYPKDGVILTITIRKGDEEFYVGDIGEFMDYFVHKATMDYYYMKTGNIAAKGVGICSICNEKGEVFGLFREFGFYTIDKIGNVSGLNPDEAWKTFPICLKCALYVKEGKNYLDEHLKVRFYGNDLYIIPKVLDEKNVGKVLKRFERMAKDFGTKDYSYRERKLFEFLSKRDIYLYISFMFFREGNDFKITQMVEDVLPSRFRRLYEEIDKIENYGIFKHFKLKYKKLSKKEKEYYTNILQNFEDKEGLRFRFGYIKEFFGNEDFLRLMNIIITNKKVDYNCLINVFISKIREKFIKDEPFELFAYKSFMIILYLMNLNILEGDIMGDDKEYYLYDEIDELFNNYNGFFDRDEKKGVFLLGVLVNKLLNLQYKKRGSKPFQSKLYGLKLDKIKVKNIFKEANQKLMEYEQEDNSLYYKKLREKVAEYLIKAGNDWKLNNNEISYIFSLGMAMSDRFKSKGGDE